MTHPERTPDPIADLMRQASHLDERESAAARAAFLERVDREAPRASRFRTIHWAGPLAVAAAALLSFFAWPDSDIRYDVTGADEDGGYIRAGLASPATLEFSDATQVRAEPGARLRVVDTTDNGARVSLEEGELAVHVTHTESSAWNFVAGPFDVHVTGTRFDLDWDPETERLRVDLHEGSVTIEGYDGAGPWPLRAGQTFVGDAKKRTMQVSALSKGPSESVPSAGELAPSTDLQPAESEAEPTLVDETAPEPPAGAVKGSTSALPASWSALVSKGKFSDVVAAAEKRGIASCVASCGASDLGALADAARYTGKNALAEQSLMALRSRFAGSSGPRAAFLLGRLAEGQGQMSSAKAWYDTSLRESPSGAYAGEALAGKMRAVLATQGQAGAAPIARDYLKRYPQGVHAQAAKKIAQP